MQRILIIGAGGHAQVVADILWRMRDAGERVLPVGFVDDDPALQGQEFLGLPVLGAIDERTHIVHDAVIVAIGNGQVRRNLFDSLRQDGERFAIARHPATIVAPDVNVQDGAMLCPGVIVNTGTMIGANAILNTGCTIDHHNRIGDHVHIAPGVHTGGEVTVGEGALIGIGATVMPQRRIGAGSIVGAGALVRDDVPDRVVVVGVPARIIKSW
jgi:sugar O-acyltransferase (sialic acid O-acetyltransferase NeuD family)